MELVDMVLLNSSTLDFGLRLLKLLRLLNPLRLLSPLNLLWMQQSRKSQRFHRRRRQSQWHRIHSSLTSFRTR